MRKSLFIITVLLLAKIAFAQNRLATKKEQKNFDRSNNCIKLTSKSFAERLKNYPFNVASRVQFVSFESKIDTLEGNTIINDSKGLPRKNDTICYSKLFEIKNLSHSQVDQLTNILYNYGYRKNLKSEGVIYIGESSLCYIPRNAILFLDKEGKVFEFIEICFECDKIEVSSPSIGLGIMCTQKLTLLKIVFKKVGLEYGIKKETIAK